MGTWQPSWLVAATAVVGAVVVRGVSDNALVDGVTYLVVMLGASVVAWTGVARTTPGRRLVPGLIAAGVSLMALGDTLAAVLEAAGVTTGASAVDAAWVLAYVMLFATLWITLGRHRVGGRRGGDDVIDAVSVVAVTVVVFWSLSIESIVSDGTLSVADRLVASIYPASDAVILALVARVLMTPGARRELGAGFAWAAGLWLAADAMFLVWPTSDTALRLIESCWLLAAALFAGTVWRAGRPRAEVPEVVPGRRGSAQLLIAVGPLFVPPTLEVVNHLVGRPHQPWTLLVSSAVLITLAVVRTLRLIRSEETAHRELERARDLAEANSRAKTVFVANVSHEIRTPLTTVLATAELLEDTPLNDLQQRMLERMDRSGRRLRALVEELLDFSRIESGEVVVTRELVDVRELVAEVVESCPARDRATVDFEWELDPRTPATIRSDPARLVQVLDHLLSNADKFTAAGVVRLDVGPSEEREDSVDLVVSDTGIGIAEHDLDAIFESFHQVDGSDTRSYEGSGLGLAIAKELTALLDGTISVSSREGVGSTFRVTLPVGVPGPDAPGPLVRTRSSSRALPVTEGAGGGRGRAG